MKQLTSTTLVCLLLFFTNLQVSQANEITQRMTTEDPHLETRINLQFPRLRLGELLEHLSKQSGAKLRIDHRANASGIPVVVSLSDVPLSSVMNALSSLVSLRAYSWRWSREKIGQEYIYRLEPVNLADMAAGLRKVVQEAFERQAVFLIQLGQLPPEERKKHLGKNAANDLLASSERVLRGHRLLAETLSPEQLTMLLRGRRIIQIPFASLSQEAQEFARKDANDRPDLLSDKVSISVQQDREDISPTLFIDFGSGGYGYTGGVPLDNELKSKVDADWKLPGDSKSEARESQKITSREETQAPALVAGKASPLSSGNAAEREWLAFAKAANVPLLAVSPPTSLDKPEGQTLAEYLKALQSNRWFLMHKWKQGILLINYPTWFLQANDNAPYEIVKKLRTLAKSRSSTLLQSLADTTYALTQEQAERLREEFPVMEAVCGRRGLFLLLHTFPEVGRNKSGTVLTERMLPYLHALYEGTTFPPQARMIRIRVTSLAAMMRTMKTPTKSQPLSNQTMVFLELLDERGTPIAATGMPLPISQSAQK